MNIQLGPAPHILHYPSSSYRGMALKLTESNSLLRVATPPLECVLLLCMQIKLVLKLLLMLKIRTWTQPSKDIRTSTTPQPESSPNLWCPKFFLKIHYRREWLSHWSWNWAQSQVAFPPRILDWYHLTQSLTVLNPLIWPILILDHPIGLISQRAHQWVILLRACMPWTTKPLLSFMKFQGLKDCLPGIWTRPKIFLII